jgi:hypothetical protein
MKEWATPFRSAQWRTRCPGGAERRQTEAATESGGKSEQGGMKVVEAERKNPRPGVRLLQPREVVEAGNVAVENAMVPRSRC